MKSNELFERTQARFLKELRHHLQGWLGKVTNNLSEEAFQAEVASLRSDPVYTAFGLDTPEYALVRMMGRLSISIGRRLGEIYDKMPRFVTQGRFNLEAQDVAPKVGGKLELDVCIPLAKLTPSDKKHVASVIPKYVPKAKPSFSGVAIEIRYNFNPNDSSRLRKDVEMAELLQASDLLPLYLIFSTISPRDEAIARLTRAGWTFLVGDLATNFMNDLIGMNIQAILRSEAVQEEVSFEIARIMRTLYESYAMQETMKKYPFVTAPKLPS